MAGCSSAPRPGTAPRPEEEWVAATCLPAAPDTTGWKVHRLSDIELAVPADFTVRNRTSRSIEFVRGGSVLSLLVSASPTRDIFFAAGRPALAKEEAGCSSSIGGYPGVVTAVARANRFSVSAEWDGGPLWGPDDWRKRLVAHMTTGSLRDAQRLRDALHTIRAARDTSLTRRDQPARHRFTRAGQNTLTAEDAEDRKERRDRAGQDREPHGSAAPRQLLHS